MVPQRVEGEERRGVMEEDEEEEEHPAFTGYYDDGGPVLPNPPPFLLSELFPASTSCPPSDDEEEEQEDRGEDGNDGNDGNDGDDGDDGDARNASSTDDDEDSVEWAQTLRRVRRNLQADFDAVSGPTPTIPLRLSGMPLLLSSSPTVVVPDRSKDDSAQDDGVCLESLSLDQLVGLQRTLTQALQNVNEALARRMQVRAVLSPCPVCLVDARPGVRMHVLSPCGHVVCKQCLDAMTVCQNEEKVKCPICRSISSSHQQIFGYDCVESIVS